MGVDAAAIGNHEYDQGVDDLLDRIEGRTDFPDLAANVTYEDTGELVHEPYAIVEHGGAKGAVGGARTTKTAGTASAAPGEGRRLGGPGGGRSPALDALPASGDEYDVLIASYHEGASANAEPGVAPANTDPIFDRIVAETSPEVDAIFNGDSHRSYAYNAPIPGQ